MKQILIFLLILSSTTLIVAQSKKHSNAVYGTFGFGEAGLNFGGTISGTLALDGVCISGAYSASRESSGEGYDDAYDEFAVLIGKVYSSRWALVSIETGLALTKYKGYDSYDNEYTDRGVGFPIQGQLMFKPLPFIGIGAKVIVTLGKKPQGLVIPAASVLIPF